MDELARGEMVSATHESDHGGEASLGRFYFSLHHDNGDLELGEGASVWIIWGIERA